MVDRRRSEPAKAEIDELVSLFSARKYKELECRANALANAFPDCGMAWKALGVALKAQGRNAVEAFERAAELLPEDAGNFVNFGLALQSSGRHADAVKSYRQALVIRPDYADALNNLGTALRQIGQYQEAEKSLRFANEISPDHPEILNNLGNVLKDQGNTVQASEFYRRALALKPAFPEAIINLGCLLVDQGKLDEAKRCFLAALELRPDHAEARFNLALCQSALAMHEAALQNYRRVISLRPEWAAAYSSFLFCLAQQHDQLNRTEVLAECRRFAEVFEAPQRVSWRAHTNVRDQSRELRVGFVSADFRRHAIANFIEPIVHGVRSRKRLELYAYYNHSQRDNVTARLVSLFHHWRDVAKIGDDALADLVRDDAIDILIDLSGHSAGNRLPCFARKPAPIQITWMGFPGTTGLSAMDYYLTDMQCLPPGEYVDQFVETIEYLPASAAFSPGMDTPPVNPLPALRNGYMTFGSFNRPNKINRWVVALWANIMRQLPSSRMLIGAMPADDDEFWSRLVSWFEDAGIEASRLTGYPNAGMDAYLRLHHEVDVCLDTFPYNGGTTTLYALWMGVPTLTIAGSTAAGRSGAAILAHVGLHDFVAHDQIEFVGNTMKWATRLDDLLLLRQELRHRLLSSPIGQPSVVAQGFEDKMLEVWKRWCAVS